MSLQVNLLPEARILKLQAQARKRTANTIMILTGIVTVTIIITLLLLLGYTYSLYQANESRISTIKSDISTQQDMEQKAATLQENLASFSALQKTRLYVSEIFVNLSKIVPSDIKLSSFKISENYVVSISGTAPSFAAVSSFSKALQEYNLNFKPQANLERKALFSDVVIASVSKEEGSGTSEVKFNMTFKVDASLFNQSVNQ
ncbi:MAG TPA: PilN domain-containing protein [Candidatus Saccharibacteria bacterium]|nr:PilN domain-containing protein [Candidatus Saccharibacteria bacterium]